MAGHLVGVAMMLVVVASVVWMAWLEDLRWAIAMLVVLAVELALAFPVMTMLTGHTDAWWLSRP